MYFAVAKPQAKHDPRRSSSDPLYKSSGCKFSKCKTYGWSVFYPRWQVVRIRLGRAYRQPFSPQWLRRSLSSKVLPAINTCTHPRHCGTLFRTLSTSAAFHHRHLRHRQRWEYETEFCRGTAHGGRRHFPVVRPVARQIGPCDIGIRIYKFQKPGHRRLHNNSTIMVSWRRLSYCHHPPCRSHRMARNAY